MVDNSSPETSKQQEQVILPAPASISETLSIIEKADAVAKRMEAANKKAEEINNRIEANLARMMLGGRAEAGAPMKTEEQLQKEDIDKQIAERLKIYS